MTNIDWKFILDKEGGIKTRGYVPDAQGSQSGVTIGGGVDLGARNEQDLEGLPDAIKAKLIPYLGLKGADALAVAGNLNLTTKEARTVTEFAKEQSLSNLRIKWENTTGQSFDSLEEAKATVIASVAFQYGDLESRTPNFWRQVTTDNWQEAVANLNNFGDKYPTRRKSEAKYFLTNTTSELKKKSNIEYAETPMEMPSEADAYDDSPMVSPVERVFNDIVATTKEEPKSILQERYEAGGDISPAFVEQQVEPAPSEQTVPSSRIDPNNIQPIIFSKTQAKAPSGLFETIGAMNAYAYSPLYNYLANKIQYGDQVEVGYNPLEDMQGYEEHKSFLLDAQNREHMQRLKSEIDANNERRQVIYNASFGTQFVAGLFDPINAVALPFAPAGGLLRSALRTGTSLAAIQGGAEIIRAPFDPLGTAEESAINIGGAFVSGMALGGLISIPSALRSRSIKKTAKEIEEFQAELEREGLDIADFVGPTKERPFAGKQVDELNVMLKRRPKTIERLRKEIDEMSSNDAYQKALKDADGDVFAARRIIDGRIRGMEKSINEYETRMMKAREELEIRKKQEAKLEEMGFGVEDPAGIVEDAFTKSWMYKGVTTPVKRFLQSKKLTTADKLDMIRLAGDSGILLNMHKFGMTNGSSVYQSAQVHNGTWAKSHRTLQELWARDTGAEVRRILDYETTNFGRGLSKKFQPEKVTYEEWLDDLGDMYMRGEENLTDLQREAITEIRRFFKDWEVDLRSEGLIGDTKALNNRVIGLEDDIEVYQGRLDALRTQKRVSPQRVEFLEARLARKQMELEEIQDALQLARETPVKPANEEVMFPRFWNKDYIRENREALEQILFDWYLSNPYVFQRNATTGKYERVKLSTDPEMVMGRAKKSVDEILGITDVTDDANAFYGYGKSKHFRHRTIDIPNKLVTEFIVKNPVTVMKAYTARVAPKYEFSKKFGGRNVEEVLDDMTDRLYDKGLSTREIFAARKDFRHMYDRVVGSVLRDPDAMNQTVADVMRFGAESNYLGSAGFSTLPDAAKIIMEHELSTVGKAMLSLLEKGRFTELMSGKEGKLAGEILEIEMGSAHMRLVEDTLNNPLNKSVLDTGRNIAYTLNLLAPMTNIMKRLESLTRGHTIIDYSIKYSKGQASEFEIQYLARYNIDKNMATEIANAPYDVTKSGLYLPNTDAWTDAIQFPATKATVQRGPTGKFKGDRYVPAFYRRNENKIYIDEDYIKNTAFPAKVWTKPKLEGVEPLDVDAFRTPQEYVNFVMMHEITHTNVSAGDLKIDLTKKGGTAAYENEINRIALEEMRKQQKVRKETTQSFREAMNSGIMNTILMGTPADKPIITDGVVYIPMNVAKRFGMKEDPQYTGYARIENAFLGMPFQFMSYSLAAANKITAAYSQNQIRNRAAGVMTSLAMGYAVLYIKTPDFVWDKMTERDKFARAFDASGLAALHSDMFYESLAMSSAFGMPDISGGLIQPKFPEDDPYAAVIGGVGGAGPSIAYDQFQAARQFINGEYGEGAKNFVRELPYARLWFLRDTMNEMTRGWAR